MASYLLCSTPVHGHVTPMLAVARDLTARGHRVTVLTGARFADHVAATGSAFRPLGGIADFDDRDPDSYLPDRHRHRGLARAQYDIQRIFVRTIPDQHRAVVDLLATEQPDAVLVDGAFAGVAPLLYGRGARPPILALGVTPLTQLSSDVAPAGTALPPSASPVGRLRNRALNVLARRVLFRQTQRLGLEMLAQAGLPRVDAFVMDISRAYDRFLQLSVPEFEYPRRDLSSNVAFVGPLRPEVGAASLPPWWEELDGSRPVVHVTQGTVDNHDTSRLIGPTIAALADLDVLVAVTMGGGDPARLGPTPPNVRVASYLPYDQLLARTDAFVTNGGYGGVQHALSAGVPLVVAGGSEDKPEVAARVGWSGAGIDLRTGTPTADAVRAAVRRVLDESSYRTVARRLAQTIATYPTLDLIHSELGAAATAR